MSVPALPPNPSLVAIILIVKTRRGIKRLFHYPPNPGKDRPHAKLDYERSSEEDSSSSSDNGSYSSLEDSPSDSEKQNGSKTATPEFDESGSVSPEKDSGDGFYERHKGKPSGFLGLPEGFDSFLCPPPQQHKRRFELTIGQLVFLGWPVFAKNGEWKRKRRSKGQRDQSRQPPKMSTISEQERVDLSSRRSSMQVDELLAETTGNESVNDELPETEDETTKTFKDLATLHEDGEEGRTRNLGPELAMFHVVFVMNPPPLEYQLRVDEMYRHVVKKFSRALKWEQSRSGYVQKECEKLKALKAKRESLVQTALSNSSLANAIATVYSYISTSRIAHIDLTTHLSFSLQIPIPTSISHLPDLTAPRLPGLWLTTATSIPSNDELHTTRSKLASHFALLLLTDLNSILADVASTSSPLSGPLTHYLKMTTPTKSFLQISQSSGIPLADIHLLASHLVYWRRARAVPPLHQRDIYIVSPNADMRKLKTASSQYAKLFPAQMPSLPKMLSQLSQGSPRPYRLLIPTKMHKPLYMDVLAWLMRGGWVTQLRSFAWVRVPPSIQALVARESDSEGSDNNETPTDSHDKHNRQEGTSSDANDDGSTGGADRRRPPPPHASGALSPGLASGVASPASQSSARTAIPLGMISSTGSLPPPKLELPSTHSDRGDHPGQPSSPLSHLHTSLSAARQYQPKLILHPTKASGLESRWLAAISREMEASEGGEVKEAWDRCLKYLNGEHALEKIPVREGWKRKNVEAWRAIWVRSGVVIEVRGW